MLLLRVLLQPLYSSPRINPAPFPRKRSEPFPSHRMTDTGRSRARRMLLVAAVFLAAFCMASAETRTPDLGTAEPKAMRLKLTHAGAHAAPDADLPSLRDLARHDGRRLAEPQGHRFRHGAGGRRSRRHHGGAAVGTPLASSAPAGQAQYVVDLEFGTPPSRSRLVVDTGSDLLWTKCQYRWASSRRRRGGFFRAENSSTFEPVRCRTDACLFMPTSACSPRLRGLCAYNYTYADGSMAGGILSFDTVSVGGVAIRNVAFGCTDTAVGSSFSVSQGVLGLGGSLVSFSSQLAPLYANRFSYCLVDHIRNPTASNFLVFGERHLTGAQRSRMRSTPLLKNPNLPTFYYLQVESLHVDGKRLPIPKTAWQIRSDGGGGTVIDSGTSLSFLLKPAFEILHRAFERLLPYPRVKFDPFGLCFNNTGVRHPYPDFWMVLAGGARFRPPANNYIIETYKGSGVSCLAFLEAAGEFASNTVGNILQQNFVVEYDRGNSRLRFAPTDCSKCN